MKHYQNSFFHEFFNNYARNDSMRLAVLLNEIAYNQEELVSQLLTGNPDEALTSEETMHMRRAITLLEEELSIVNLKKMPRWFWDDTRFYADPRKPDFVVNNDNPRLKQLLMDEMFTQASNNFLQRSTFFHKHSLTII